MYKLGMSIEQPRAVPSEKTFKDRLSDLRKWVLGDKKSDDTQFIKKPDEKEAHVDHELETLINQEWDRQQHYFDGIKKLGMQAYYAGLPDKEKAFFTKEEMKKGWCACCSDEGNRRFLGGKDHAEKLPLVRTPGSWILKALDPKYSGPFDPKCIEDVAKEAKEAGITVFTGHAGCGAAKAVLIAWKKQQGEKDPKVTPEEVDAFAKKWAEAVAEQLHVQPEFITKLQRPEKIHVARCLYITDIKEFDASYEGLPQGFVLNIGKEDNLAKVMDHGDILRNIAYDKGHGFGNKFGTRPEEQFVVICIAKDAKRLGELTAAAKKKMESLPPAIAKTVRVDGFTR